MSNSPTGAVGAFAFAGLDFPAADLLIDSFLDKRSSN
jgi:hypothetical protein